MIKVILLGAGNVATHLVNAFQSSENVQLTQMYNRDKEKLTPFKGRVKTTTHMKNLEVADFYILALKDDIIEEVASKMPKVDGIVAHTSGGKSIEALSRFKAYGVFYPLQSFSKNRWVNFKEIPLCLEANSKENLEKLKFLGKEISGSINEVSSEDRKVLHAAAVFANNFTNHLYQIAEDICKQNGLSFELLKPLIKETAAKISDLSPRDAQTGPALRDDRQTIATHLETLPEEYRDLYKFLTASIQKSHGKEL